VNMPFVVELTSIKCMHLNKFKTVPVFYIDLLLVDRNNMGGSPDQWDNRMVDHLKNFDLSSPEVKQQFGEC
jgi:hypothetical protein